MKFVLGIVTVTDTLIWDPAVLYVIAELLGGDGKEPGPEPTTARGELRLVSCFVSTEEN